MEGSRNSKPNHREPRKLDELEPGGRQRREPARPPNAPDRAGRTDWAGATGNRRAGPHCKNGIEQLLYANPPRNLRDMNRCRRKKNNKAQLEGRWYQRQTPQPTRNSPQR